MCAYVSHVLLRWKIFRGKQRARVTLGGELLVHGRFELEYATSHVTRRPTANFRELESTSRDLELGAWSLEPQISNFSKWSIFLGT